MNAEILTRFTAFLAEEVGVSGADRADMIVLAETSLVTSLDDLEAALLAGDAARAGDAAHGLKGLLRNMGLADLADLARTLEIEAAAGRLASRPGALADLRQRLEPLDRGRGRD